MAGRSDQLSRFLTIVFTLGLFWGHITTLEPLHQRQHVFGRLVNSVRRDTALVDGCDELVEAPFGRVGEFDITACFYGVDY
jgi:hypothetical protein